VEWLQVTKEQVMKKLVIAWICWFMLMPGGAWGQKWVEPYTASDGTQVEGHWQTPDDRRQGQYSTPGKVNPYTGQFNPYTGSTKNPQPATPGPPPPLNPNPYYPPQPDYKYRGW
jgi:hypothetical protein